MSWTGECNCGAIQVTIKAPPSEKAGSIICHCMNCKKQSGAGGTYLLIVPTTDVTITGSPKLWLDTKTDSGRPVERYFCGDCGCPIKSMMVEEALPGQTILKMGLFKDVPKPSLEIFTKNRLDWEPKVEDAQQNLD